MSYVNEKRYEPCETAAPRAWLTLLGLFWATVIIVVAAKIAWNLYPKRSNFLTTENVAAETYSQYSMRLEAIKKKCFNELETIADKD